MKKCILFLTITFIIIGFSGCEKKPADKMEWWRDAKFGMFIHWGIYSVPAGVYENQEIGGIGEWIMNTAKIPVSEYAEYAKSFNPVSFDAEQWVLLAKNAGMRYIVITSKHHDGFAMFGSKASPYNIVDATPFKRDVIKELAAACKKYHMPLGLYYSEAQDWHHAGGAAIGGHWDEAQNGDMDKYIDEIALPQVKEILNNYGDIKILWWDTPTDMTPERAAKFMTEISKHPDLIFNDRLGGDVQGDLETPEQFIPATGIPGKNWESCMTMNDTWGFKKHDNNWKSTQTLIRNLIDIASKGGNYLLNVGPDSQGLIPNASIERLKEIGDWMKFNSEAIYGSMPSPFNRLDWGRCTMKKEGKKSYLYLYIFDKPVSGTIDLPGLANKVVDAHFLTNEKKKVNCMLSETGYKIDVSNEDLDKYATIIKVEIKGDVIVHNAPEILTKKTIFTDEAEFEISQDKKDEVVRYTIDNTEPTINSPEAKGKIVISLNKDFKVIAAGFVNGKKVSPSSELGFTKVDPKKALKINKTTSGLRYSYYEGIWDSLPDFSHIKPIEEGITGTIDVSKKKKDTNYGIVFNGFVNIPETGIYCFSLTSDDGSFLSVGGESINNDGLHAMTTKTLHIALAKGLHEFSIKYFQKGGGDGLELKISRNGTPENLNTYFMY
jgi:alpha-L-fucosidase